MEERTKKMKIKEILFKRMVLRKPTKHELVHHGHTAAHISYLSAAAWEMHGFYSMAAGALLMIIVAGLFIGEEL